MHALLRKDSMFSMAARFNKQMRNLGIQCQPVSAGLWRAPWQSNSGALRPQTFSTLTWYKKIFKWVETTWIAEYHEDCMNWYLKDVVAFELLHWQRFHFQLVQLELSTLAWWPSDKVTLPRSITRVKKKDLKISRISRRSFSTQTTHESRCHGTAP